MTYRLRRIQQLYCDLDTAWSFFSSPHNLSIITPKEMKFTVLTNFVDKTIHEGMLIDYTVSPLFGIKLKWRTCITQVDYKNSFTDFQVKGPYAYWNHFHEFIPNKDGVLMKDTVDYQLPYGLLGRILHRLLVKNKLEYIFKYRYNVLEKLFNNQ